MEINNEFNTALELVYKAANEETKKALETNFPQLRGSEDERIRKELISFVNKYYGEETKKEALAYLEKQKEQKLSTPKYRVGEVMRTKQEAAEGITDGLPVIVSVDDNYYYCTNEKIPISEQEEYEFPPMNIRQKAMEWSEEDEWKRNELLKYLEEKGDYRSTWYSWLKSLPERFNPQPKQEWSEDDEQYLLVCKNALKKYQQSDHWDANIISKWLEEKLKSLRPQPKQEWSENDEKMFDQLKEILNIVDAELCKKLNGEAILIGEAEFNYLKFGIAHCLSWLELRIKSLRPQPHWKPSKNK